MKDISPAFSELVSPFLRSKIEETERLYGRASRQYASIVRQYIGIPEEAHVLPSDRLRHYGADLHGQAADGAALKGMERLYRRTVVLELTTVCYAHCRWCLRSNYSRFSLRKEDIVANIRLLGSGEARTSVREILITGGDPMINPQLLDYALGCITTMAKNIEIVRIGTRMFGQNPDRIDDEVIAMLAKHVRSLRIEFGTQINSPVEFWPETVAAIGRIKDLGITVYNQHPLLKGVNDDVDTLIELYDGLRHYGIEAHYLFHCVPMRGMHHHRTSLQKGLHLIRRLTAGGYFSGRAKPEYTAMTDIGKISLYEGTVLARKQETNEVLLQSGYSYEERLRYNHAFALSNHMEVDSNGLLRVWYPDGEDDDFWSQKAPLVLDQSRLPGNGHDQDEQRSIF